MPEDGDRLGIRRRGGRPAAGRGVYDAIADPTRRAILDHLAAGPRAAGEVALGFAVSRPAISKHLRALEDAGLVRVTKTGRKRLYALDPGPLAEVDRWLTRYRTMWAARLVAIKRHVESGRQEAPVDAQHGDPRDDADND